MARLVSLSISSTGITVSVAFVKLLNPVFDCQRFKSENTIIKVTGYKVLGISGITIKGSDLGLNDRLDKKSRNMGGKCQHLVWVSNRRLKLFPERQLPRLS